MYPKYQDFGKSTREFFSKGFQTGSYKLNLKDQPTKWITAKITGSHNIEKAAAKGDFQAELTCPVIPGFTSTTKWTTASMVKQEFSLKDFLTCGLTLGLEGQYNMEEASFEGTLKPTFRHRKFTFDALVNGGDTINPIFGGSLVTGWKNIAAGYDFEYDPTEGNMKKSNAAAAWVTGPYSFFSSLENADILWSGFVYRLDSNLEFGVLATYKAEPDGFTLFGACMKYVMDCCTAFKLKVDSDGEIALGFESKIRQNAAVTMSAKIDATAINEGGHTVGLTFDLEC